MKLRWLGLSCLLGCVRAIPDADAPVEVAPTRDGIDLAGFVALEPVVRILDGGPWIAFDAGPTADPRYLVVAPVTRGRGACSKRKAGAAWTFKSDPPMRLHLGRDGAAVEALDDECWRSITVAPAYTPGQKVSARGSTREPLTVPLDGIDARLDELTLDDDELELVTTGGSLGERFDDAFMPSWAPDDPADYEQEFQHERQVEISALLGADGALAELLVTAREVGDGDPSYQGGSHHHLRTTVWRIAMGAAPATIELRVESSASWSGDGSSGTDHANLRRTAMKVPGGAILGRWQANQAGPFTDDAEWMFEDLSGQVYTLGLPFDDNVRTVTRDEAITTREPLGPDVFVAADGKAVRIERQGYAPVLVPLLDAPYTDRDRVELAIGMSDDERVAVVEARASRRVDPDAPPVFGDYGEELSFEAHASVRLYVSIRTPQVLRLGREGPEPL